jgi:hypothetical protein
MSQLTSNRPLKFFEWEGDCFHCPELAHVVEMLVLQSAHLDHTTCQITSLQTLRKKLHSLPDPAFKKILLPTAKVPVEVPMASADDLQRGKDDIPA